MDHVEVDELARMLRPELAGQVRGVADVNLAFRGSGFARPGAASNLEAKARVYLDRLVLPEEDEPSDKSEESLAGKLGRMAEEIAPEATGAQPDLPARLTENRAAGWFTLRDGILSTGNLVAVYEGKLVEIEGSVDLAGQLNVEMGRLFVGGRMIPFQVDCRLGKEPCKPRPDLKEMGKSAAAELGDGIRTLSEGAAGVFEDLLF
jgi:hypothetical protein